LKLLRFKALLKKVNNFTNYLRKGVIQPGDMDFDGNVDHNDKVIATVKKILLNNK